MRNLLNKHLLFLLIAGLLAGTAAQLHGQSETGWGQELAAAKASATASNKPILLVFSGSDWCKSCIRLEKEVFATALFQEFAGQRLVLLQADFPRARKNRLSKDQRAQNDALAEKFNPKGDFPKVVLIDAGEKLIAEIKADNPPEQFVAEISALLEKISSQTSGL